MHTIKDRAVVVDGKIEVRPVMIVALTYDHRLLDGREATTFLGKWLLRFVGRLGSSDAFPFAGASAGEGVHRRPTPNVVGLNEAWWGLDSDKRKCSAFLCASPPCFFSIFFLFVCFSSLQCNDVHIAHDP